MNDDKLQLSLENNLDKMREELNSAIDEFELKLKWTDIGRVTSVYQGVASIQGLPGVAYEEVVEFENGAQAIAFNIYENQIGCVLLSDTTNIKAGMEVRLTGRTADTLVGDDLIGRTIDPTGKVLDNKGDLTGCYRAPIEGAIPSILDRAPVSKPLETGNKVIDTLIPIGKGQRELFLGDRQTGKTSLALDIILNQKDKNVICIYCAIGQRSSSIANAIALMEKHGALDYSLLVVAEGNSSPGVRFIAPYAATTIGEYFMKKGQDVLIVYDDLTNHARTHREISLLLRRPPGREAFPGDIFHVHSRLLERSTHLAPKLGGGSLTAIPIIETQSQDISAYIPTNLISITDGQVYLSSTLFQKDVLPAIDINLSVSRVGGKAQIPAFRSVASDLKLAYSQFEELESFSRFGTRIDPATKSILEHGARIRACFNQQRFDNYSTIEQITVFLALQESLFDAIKTEDLDRAQMICRQYAKSLDDRMKTKILNSTSKDISLYKTIVQELNSKLKSLKVKRSGS